MSKSQCDVLRLDWSSSGRDTEVAIPVCYTLRKKGYFVVEASIFNYKYYLLKYKPRLLFVAGGSTGAIINYQCVKFAFSLGIPVVTGTAEGDLNTEAAEQMVWGHNKAKILYEQLNFQWSVRAKNIVKGVAPELIPHIKVTGGVGFDRYKIYSFRTKADWMKKYKHNYQRMIGYAGWGFDGFYRESTQSIFLDYYGPKVAKQVQRSAMFVNNILRQLITNNPDTLFLLKEHPGVVNPRYSELFELRDYPNTLYIKNDEPIADCISGCDIWMAFESTTCLEAWLLETPTLLINPCGSDFARSNLYAGSPIFESYQSLQAAIDTYYETGMLPSFAEKAETRQQLVTDTIQWDDGKNHLRAVYYIERLFQQNNSHHLNITIKVKMKAFIQNILYQSSVFMPARWKFYTYQKARINFSLDQLDALYQKYAPYLDTLHQQNPLSAEDILELKAINDNLSQRVKR